MRDDHCSTECSCLRESPRETWCGFHQRLWSEDPLVDDLRKAASHHSWGRAPWPRDLLLKAAREIESLRDDKTLYAAALRCIIDNRGDEPTSGDFADDVLKRKQSALATLVDIGLYKGSG